MTNQLATTGYFLMAQMGVSQNGIHGGRHGETNLYLLGVVMEIFHLVGGFNPSEKCKSVGMIIMH